MKKKSKGSMDCCESGHPSYAAQLPRLNRIAGQIEGVRSMIEQGRYCPDILTQLRAARSALHALEANILEAHLDACVREAFEAQNDKEKENKIQELKTLYRRFDS